MAKGRKNGCPTNIRDWAIYIQDKTQVNETWVRIKGLSSMTRSTDADTEDGSAVTDIWEEPYITKRSGSISLEGKPIIVGDTGAHDPGQAMLDDYALDAGCEADATIKIVDPYGSAVLIDAVVTSTEQSADDTEETVSWDLEQVGEAERLAYVNVTSIALQADNDAVSALALTAGGTGKIITITFNPATASNQRFRVGTSNKRIAAISNIGDDTFTIVPMSAGSATVTVTSVNGSKTASIAVTVS